MKAIAIKAFGGPEGLAVVDLPTPRPAAGQALIATEAVGVGGVDVLIRSGALAAYGFREGFVPGGEVAGRIIAVGPGVDTGRLGQRVWAATDGGGGYAEQALAAVDHLVPLPAALTAVDAVTLGSAGAVAYFALERARFVAGERVLVRGAAGSIGIAAVQLAARGGAAAVAVTTSSPARGERLRALGATHVLDRAGYSADGSAPAEYDVIIDVVAGPDLPAFLDTLAADGRLVVVGAVGGPPPADLGARMMAAFQRSLSFSTLSLATVSASDLRAARGRLFAAAGLGELTTVVHEVLPLDGAESAHRKMDAGEVLGRIVLMP